MKYKMPMRGVWKVWDDAMLERWRADGRGRDADALMQEYALYRECPIRRGLPHGVPWRDKPREYADGQIVLPPSKYPKEWRNDGVAFLNDRESDYLMLLAPRKTGKEQPHDAIVQTPYGPRKIGDLLIGDQVYGRDGKAHNVIDIEEQGIKPVFRVEIDHGEESTECGAGHLWWYLRRERAHRRNNLDDKHRGANFNKWEVLTTREIAQHHDKCKSKDKWGYIPLAEPVEGVARKDLPIRPYMMGLLLGDGHIGEHAVSFASKDKEIVSRLNYEAAWAGCQLARASGCNYGVRRIGTRDNPVIRRMKDLGLCGKLSADKFIPQAYMLADVRSRKELLAGLLDTDAHVGGKYGQIEYYTVSPHLARQVRELCLGLGGRVGMSIKKTHYKKSGVCVDCQDCYRLRIRLTFNPFRLERKRAEWKRPTRRDERRITSITYVGHKPCRCIGVDSPDQTYLTDGFIVTHNSYMAAMWLALHAVPCDPDWPIFTEHGIKYVEWTGPKVIVFASFSWSNVQDLWNVYREVFPVKELGKFARGGGAALNFKRGNVGEIELASGTILIPLCYTQRQSIWESYKAWALHADEQIPKNLLRAWEDGSSTFGDWTPALFTLSGFVTKDRADTGAAGPLKPIWDGVETRAGKKVGRYNLDVESTPDVILSPAKKKERYDRYVNPALDISEQDRRRGLAVYYPGWEYRSGLCFGPDVWEKRLHVIAPLWEDGKAPKGWTKWRVVDYCDNKTTCVSWFAVGPIDAPNGRYVVAVLYRLLYEQEQTVSDLVRRIVELSHNTRRPLPNWRDDKTEITYPNYEEMQEGEVFYSDLLDSRVAPLKRNNMRLIDSMRMYGMQNLREACGERNEDQIPLLKDWLRIDMTKAHPWLKEKDGKPVMGCPRLFFFDLPCVQPAIAEIENMPCDPSEGARHVIDKSYPHDFIDTAKYWASDQPCYMGDVKEGPEKFGDASRKERDSDDDSEATPFTGY